jgi:hypothetical protein
LIDKLGYASSAVTGTVVVLFLADIYVLKVNVAMNVAGIFALALFLALASGAALKTWRREIIAKPSLKLSRNAGFWIIAEAYLFGVVYVVALVLFGMILTLPPVFTTRFGPILHLIGPVIAIIAIVGFAVLLVQRVRASLKMFRERSSTDTDET